MKFAAVACSFAIAILCVEIGFRVYFGSWALVNFTGVGSKQDRTRGLFIHDTTSWVADRRFGWIPRPGSSAIVPGWGNAEVSILADGLRSNGPSTDPTGPPAGSPTILAVGDSFTFGDQVSDHQTWPAILEAQTRCTVLNGGVFGYGIDQAFLRATELARKYEADIVIFSLIPKDISRCEFAVSYGVRKPFFTVLADGGLELRNYPVPDPAIPEPTLDLPRRVLGYSAAAHTIIGRLQPVYWYSGRLNQRVHHDGEIVSCLLLTALTEQMQAAGTPVLVVLQYDTLDEPYYLEQADRLKACLGDRATILDLRSPLVHVRESRPDRFEGMFDGHMTEAGNRFVALEIEAALAAEGWIPRTGDGHSP